MEKFKPAIVFSFLGIATFASLVGTVSGTLAWYAYNARATLSYSGTSIENSVQLQIGLASSRKMPHIDNDENNEEFWSVMSEITYPEDIIPNSDPVEYSTYYYFAPLGYGINSAVINAYLSFNGYATNELAPATSGFYDPKDVSPYDNEGNFTFLKKGPSVDQPNSTALADTANYLKLQFVFRASKSKTSVDDFVGNQEIWLTDAQGAASNSERDGNVYKAMRIFFDRKDSDYTSDFIVNPSALKNNQGVSLPGETKVGGLLDLSADGYYDFDEDGEIIYGEWDTDDLMDPSVLLTDEDLTDGNPYRDLNDTGSDLGTDRSAMNTFTSRHHIGTKYYTYESLNSIPFKTAKYESLDSIKPTRDATGSLSNPLVPDPDDPTQEITKVTSVCKTADETGHFIASVDAYIWIEGWDFNVVDEEQRHAFDLGLTFETNKVGGNS